MRDTSVAPNCRMPDHLQIPYARKEIALNKWRRSGYHDYVAYEDYLYWFEVCQGWRETSVNGETT